MKPISHPQARSMIDGQEDGLLTESNNDMLQAHLSACAECRAYAAEIQSLENSLTVALNERWGQPILSVQVAGNLAKNLQETFVRGGEKMSEPFVDEGNQSKSLLLQPRVWGVAALALLLVAVFIPYNDYRSNAGQPPFASQASQVSISQPSDGQEIGVLNPLSVNAIAAGPIPFLSMELWINGELSGVQAAASEGKHPFSTSFAWLPKEAGVFSLVARAVDENNQTSTSSAVLVFVTAKEEGNGGLSAALADVPAVLPGAPGGYSPPSPPGGSDSVEPADNWNGSPGDWVNSFGNDGPPNAPEITVEQAGTDGCDAQVNIHDLSDNEEGFAVYLQLTSSPNFVKIATLAANSQSEWITHTTQHAVGGITFYVSSFNAEGEAQSNLAVINIDPNDCPLNLAEGLGQSLPVLAVQIEALTLVGLSPDMVYCYQSINGSNWARWPLTGFFYPDEGGAFAQDEIFQLVLGDLEGNVTADSFVLNLNCWGWFGPQLQFIGSFELNNADLSPGNFSYDDDILAAGIDYEVFDDAPIYELGPAGDQETAISQVGDLVAKSYFPPDMVYFNIAVTYDPEQCTSHLPPDAQNLFGTILFCFPYPGFHGGLADGDNPQPYLIWDATQSCPAGFGTDDIGGPCKDYDDYIQLAEDNGGKVGFTIYDNSSAGIVEWNVAAPYLQNFTIPPNGCDGARSFFVQMWYQEAGFTQRGPVSTDATITCPKPVGNVVTLDFVFESLTFNNIDDGESSPQDVEVYGYFQVMAPSSQLGNKNYLKIGSWDAQASNCPDDISNVSNPPLGCPQVFQNGNYNLYNVPMCKSSDYTQSDKFQCFSQITSNYMVGDLFQTNNNKLRVEVQEGDGINLHMVFHDWDDASANDLVCFGVNNELGGGMSIFQWDAIDGQGFAMIGFGSDGTTCSMSGVIHVIK